MPSPKKSKLIILGDSVFAQIAYEYFTHDSDYEVVAFSVERRYVRQSVLFGLPVVPFEQLADRYSTDGHAFFAAIVFSEQNRLRTRLYQEARRKGYETASYLSSRAFISRSSRLGEHCFVCEGTSIQSLATIANNVILWSGNFIGHRAAIGHNCFTLPHAVISSGARLGENCIVGANCIVAEGVCIAAESTLEPGRVYSSTHAAPVVVPKKKRPFAYKPK